MAKRKPDWLRPLTSTTPLLGQTRRLLAEEHLPTVCASARCPNRENCYSASTATFLILGLYCTRNCRFCSVEKAGWQDQDTRPSDRKGLSSIKGYQKSLPVDPEEPLKVARAVKQLGLSYVVITSTTRDDLLDGGAGQFAETIDQIKKENPGCLVEVLIPDLVGLQDRGDRGRIFDRVKENLNTVITAGPVVLGHNLETVPSLYPRVRSKGDYGLSLEILRWTKEKYPRIMTKSSLILGLGEKLEEVRSTLQDLKQVHCDIIVLGQYLQPTKEQVEVQEYITPEQFADYKKTGLKLGIPAVLAGPLLRSSYRAAEVYRQIKKADEPG